MPGTKHQQDNMMRTFLWITFFATAMAFLESAVVVYLRELYYPGGFDFPLRAIDPDLAVTEIIREAATLIMLLSVAMLASRRRGEAVAWFIYAFAVWDIFYYVFLWLILGWPSSLLTWDLLFLIPVAWTGPVLAPVINSLTMIMMALPVICFSRHGLRVGFKVYEWLLIVAGSLLTLAAYMMDYTLFLAGEFSFGEIFSMANSREVMAYAETYVPVSFNWYLFATGELLFMAMIVLYVRRLRTCKA